MNTPLQALMFDLDGTLVHTLADIALAVTRSLEAIQRPPCPESVLADMIGNGGEVLLQRALAWGGADPEFIAASMPKLWPLFLSKYAECNGLHSQVYDGVIETLTWAKSQGYRLAVVTNKPTRASHKLLAMKKLNHYFDVVVGGDTCSVKKPHPRPLLTALSAMNVAPEAAMMIGDSVNDAQAADAAHCHLILVTYGYNHGEDITDIPACQWVQTMHELPHAILHETHTEPLKPLCRAQLRQQRLKL